MLIKSGPVAVISDVHGEFVDERAFGVALEVLRYVQPGAIALNGDWADFYQVSRFQVDPAKRLGLQDALFKTQELMAVVRGTCPDADLYFIKGNHEDRLRKYLWDRPELAPLKSLEVDSLLALGEMGIDPVPDGEMLSFGDFIITHGEAVRSRGGYTAHAMLDRYGCSGVSGHTHRLAQVTRTQWIGDQTWIEGGCLCKLEAEYLTAPGDWQQGFTILNSESGEVWPELVAIRNGRAFYDGRVFRN